MTGLEIVAGLATIVASLAALEARREAEQARLSAALKALSTAVTATQEYVDLEAKEEADQKANYELTDAWHQASLAFRDAGESELEDRCRIKGNYWLDPENWSADQIDESRIRLAEMRGCSGPPSLRASCLAPNDMNLTRLTDP